MPQEIGFGGSKFGLGVGKFKLYRRRRLKRARISLVWAAGSGSKAMASSR